MIKHMFHSQLPFRQLIILAGLFLLVSTACSLPFFAQTPENVPVTAETRPQGTVSIPTQRAQAQSTTEVIATATMVPQSTGNTAVPGNAPDDIPAAEQPAIPDCNAFDIAVFNNIVAGSFTFITQDQLNNCIYQSDNGYNLVIGGGKPTSLTEIQTQFNNTFGTLPDSSWEAIDNFYLGLAFSSVTVTAQGVSGSGHSLVILAASQVVDNQSVLGDLAREAARQLNQQW